MARVSRLQNPQLAEAGFDAWGDRPPLPKDPDAEILDADQMFRENSVPGSKIWFSRMRVGVNRDTNVLFINDDANTTYPSIDIRRSVGTGSGIYIQSESPSGYALDILQNSNTPGLHIVSAGSGAFVVPVQLQNNTATSTNYYKIAEMRGTAAPAVTTSIWVANNVSPNGILTGTKGDLCTSSNGKLYINTDGATAWTELTGDTTITEHIITTEFSSSTRTPAQVSANATATFVSSGIQLNTVGSGATPYAFISWEAIYNTQGDLYNANPKFSFNVTPEEGVNKVDNSAFYGGLGAITFAAGSITFSDNHIGFKIVRESGTRNLYATQGNGSNEAVSSVLTTVASGDCLELIAHVTSGTSTTYYWRKNGGALSSGTTLSTYMPTATTNENVMRLGGHCTGTNDSTIYILSGASYRR